MSMDELALNANPVRDLQQTDFRPETISAARP
jgi:hypothetical protein